MCVSELYVSDLYVNDVCVSVLCVEAEAAEAADGRRGEDLKTRTPHNDVGNKGKWPF